jgi:pyruvate dehydrogenase E2 component (dihydrolipoamide acetyltransferase)
MRLPVTTVLVDLPGHGASRSRWPGSLDEAAALVASLLADVGVGTTVLVGHSLGAAVAIHLDRLLGTQNRATLLMALGANDPKPRPSSVSFASTHAEAWIATTAALLFAERFPPVYRRAAEAGLTRIGLATITAALEAFSQFDSRTFIGLEPAPRILLSGAADPFVSRAAARLLATRIGAVHHVVADVGHFIFLEKPDVVHRALNDLISSVERHPSSTMDGRLSAAWSAAPPAGRP